jgi:CRP/FNR family transcriptional regulator
VTTTFSDFPRTLLDELEDISYPLSYPNGSALFVEGAPPRGVFNIRTGRAKLFIRSGDGKTLILRLANPGDVLGLPGTLFGMQYEATAETIGPTQVAFIKREPFLRFMYAHKEVSQAVAHQLAAIYNSACHGIRCLGLAHSAGEKLAQLLLEWPLSNGDTPSHIRFALRHEDVAQMIGTSRETVSRLFTELKRRAITELNGTTLQIHDRTSLQAIAAGTALISLAELCKHKSGRKSGTKGKAHPLSGQRVGRGYSDSDFHPDGV